MLFKRVMCLISSKVLIHHVIICILILLPAKETAQYENKISIQATRWVGQRYNCSLSPSPSPPAPSQALAQ